MKLEDGTQKYIQRGMSRSGKPIFCGGGDYSKVLPFCFGLILILFLKTEVLNHCKRIATLLSYPALEGPITTWVSFFKKLQKKIDILGSTSHAQMETWKKSRINCCKLCIYCK
jgi:hypothetical protein